MKVKNADVGEIVAHPLSQELFGDMDDAALNDLKEDIRKRGLQHLPEIDGQDRVICGSQRLRAVRELGWTQIQVNVRDDLTSEQEIEEHLIKDNTERRELTPQQRYHAAKKLEEIYSGQARERQGTRTDIDDTSASKETQVARAATQAAEDVGMSGTSYHRIKTVMESDREDIKDALNSGELSVRSAHDALKVNAPPIEDDGHSETLRFLQYKRTLEKFDKYVLGHPKRKYNGYAQEIENMVDKTIIALQEWKSHDKTTD